MKAVILAAGVGSRLLPLTAESPKALVDVAGVPLLVRTLERLAAVGLSGDAVVVVAGHREDLLRRRLAGVDPRVRVISNPRFADWNNFWSLALARPELEAGGFLLVDGDLLLDGEVLPRVLAAAGPAALAVDRRAGLDAETMKVEVGPAGLVRAIAKSLDPARAIGEYIGVLRVDAPAATQVFDELERLAGEGLVHEYYEHAFHRLAGRGALDVRVVDVSGCAVTEIDDADDLARATAIVLGAGGGSRRA